VAFNPGESLILANGLSGNAMIREVASGRVHGQPLETNTSSIWIPGFSPDGQLGDSP
jgi:hypothetical protein